jgi:hypothetical protein
VTRGISIAVARRNNVWQDRIIRDLFKTLTLR